MRFSYDSTHHEWDSFFLNETNYYHATTKATFELTHLAADGQETEVVVVGGGFTGMALAIDLADRGFDVVVLERHNIGFGASGRNGGQVLPGFEGGIQRLSRSYGQEFAKTAWQFSVSGVEAVRENIRNYNIECNETDGTALGVMNKSDMRSQQKEADLLEGLVGMQSHVFDKEAFAEKLGSDYYHGGVLLPKAFHINPLKYLYGLTQVAHSKGVKIYEDSSAEAIVPRKGSQGYEVYTASGSLKCQYIALCGDAYMGRLVPRLRSSYLLLRTYMVATEPLPEGSNVLPSDWAIDETRTPFYYYRKSFDNRLLFGGGDTVGVVATNQKERDKSIADLVEDLEYIFPQLKGTQISHTWGGYVGVNKQRMPAFGELNPGIFYANGYSGRGIACTHASAKLLAEAIDGNKQVLNVFDRHKLMYIPGGGMFDNAIGQMALGWHRLLEFLPR